MKDKKKRVFSRDNPFIGLEAKSVTRQNGWGPDSSLKKVGKCGCSTADTHPIVKYWKTESGTAYKTAVNVIVNTDMIR